MSSDSAVMRLVQADQGNLVAVVQDETVILQQSTGQYFGLNKVGARVWQLIQAPTTLNLVVEQLEREFEVDRHTLEADVIRILDELQACGLAAVVNTSE